MDSEAALALVGVFGAAVGAIAAGVQRTRQRRKEKVAAATKSALKRVEMYYRIVRRATDGSDDNRLRDRFHVIQENNDFFISLLGVESPWLGRTYRRFIDAIKRETEPLMQEAWRKKPLGQSAELKNMKHPDIQVYKELFTKDSRRFFNPVMRVWMRLRYSISKHIGDDGYGKY